MTEDKGTPIPLTINIPPVAKQPVTVGIGPELWPRGQGAAVFNDNTFDAKPLKERE